MNNEFNINKEIKEFSDNCDEEYKKNYVFKLVELMIKNPDYDSDSDDSL